MLVKGKTVVSKAGKMEKIVSSKCFIEQLQNKFKAESTWESKTWPNNGAMV